MNPTTASSPSAARGDRPALEQLLERHADRIHAVCRRIVANPDDALDATQEALIAVARGITRFDGRAAFTTWIYRVATNAALDEVRRQRRRPRPDEDVVAASVAAGTPVEDQVGARIDVDAALRTLPDEFRVAVVLRDLCDLDYAEIAEVLEVPPGTVRSRISRGRAALAELLGNREHPRDVRVMMVDDDNARDEHLGAILEVEPLDDVTRRRLVSTAMGATTPDRSVRWIAAAAVVIVLLVGGLVALLAAGGTDDRQAATPALSPARPSTSASGSLPGAESKQAASVPASPNAQGSAVPSSAAAGNPNSTTDGGAPVDVGEFGELTQANNLTELRRALTPSDSTFGSAAGRPSGHGSALLAELTARGCTAALPAGTVTAVATGTIDGRRAVVVETTTDDGTRSIDAAVGDPCTVRPLS